MSGRGKRRAAQSGHLDEVEDLREIQRAARARRHLALVGWRAVRELPSRQVGQPHGGVRDQRVTGSSAEAGKRVTCVGFGGTSVPLAAT